MWNIEASTRACVVVCVRVGRGVPFSVNACGVCVLISKKSQCRLAPVTVVNGTFELLMEL